MKKAKRNQGNLPYETGVTTGSIGFLPILTYLIVFFVPFLLYASTISYGFILDDPGVLEKNRFIIEGFSGIPDIITNSYRAGVNIFGDNIYRPLSQVMFAMEWSISPGNPKIHHLVNILFYAFSCLLLLILLKRTLVKVQSVVILLVVMLFAVHPIHTEVVAYIKCRDEIMSLFFLLISFILFHRWLLKAGGFHLGGAAISFFLALMSKEGVVTMLAVFPLMAWYFTPAGRSHIATGAVVMVLPAAVYILIRHTVLSDTPDIWGLAPVDNFLVLAPDWGTRVSTAVMILGKYLALLIFPHPLVNDYSYAQMSFTGLTAPGFLLSALIFMVFLGTIAWRFRKKEPWVFGLAFFIISISIYSNLFFLIGTAFGERLMFVPSLGFCMAVILLADTVIPSRGPDAHPFSRQAWKSKKYLIAMAGLVIVIFTVTTIFRNLEWKSNETLITADVLKNPKSARLQHHLGNLYRDQARFTDDRQLRTTLTRKSLSAYQEALKIYPAHDDSQEQAGLAWYLLGYPDMGAFYFRLVLNKNPMRQDSWNNLGNILADKGDLPAALEAFRKATSIHPWFAEAWRNTGSVLGRMGRYEEAVPCFLKTVELEPDNALACQFLGLTYQNLGKNTESRYWYDRAGSLGYK